MEKRFFLAILLSLLILYMWQGTRPKSIPEETAPGSLQDVENKDVAASSPPPPSSIQSPHAPEKITFLESDKIIAEFSNVGGMLKNIRVKEYGAEFAAVNMGSLSGYEHMDFDLDGVKDNQITYVYRGKKGSISKTYKLVENEYYIEASIKIDGAKEMSKLKGFDILGINLDMSILDIENKTNDQSAGRDRSLLEYVISSENGIHRKNNAYKFSEKERVIGHGDVGWAGFRDRYFCLIFKPLYDVGGYSVNPVNDKNLQITVAPKDVDFSLMDSVTFSYAIYAGPEKTSLLKRYAMGFEDIKRYYKFSLFDAIAKIIASIMHGLNKVIPNWGVCIILISIIIYFSMYPLTLRSMASMKGMQALQPQIAKMREKHKNNPQKMNMEMMELYKKHKINPLGGCLPMLLQMPVFIGLYQVLWRSVSLKGASFLWIKDLSEPDRIFILPFQLPIVGNEVNLLPLIMVIVMAFQQKFTARSMVAADPAQAAQQKMMGAIMPVFLGFIFYKFASGLTLYFTMFYLFSTFTQWKMSKEPKVI